MDISKTVNGTNDDICFIKKKHVQLSIEIKNKIKPCVRFYPVIHIVLFNIYSFQNYNVTFLFRRKTTTKNQDKQIH